MIWWNLVWTNDCYISWQEEAVPLRIVSVGLMLLGGLVAAWLFLPIQEYLFGFAEWMSDLGTAGIASYVVIYTVVTLAMGPVWALSVAAGVAFGIGALLLVLPSALGSAAAAFLVARYLARDRIAPYIRSRARLEAIDWAVEEHGIKSVLLLRLSPLLPYGAKSYFFGLSRVKLLAYLVGTAVGILPGSALYVSIGAAGQAPARGGPGNATEWTILVVGLSAAAAMVTIIQRASTKKLHEMDVA